MLAVAFPSMERVDYHGMYQQSPVLPMDGLFIYFLIKFIVLEGQSLSYTSLLQGGMGE